MVKVTIEKSLREQLDRLHEETQLCDESGRTIGYYLPESLRHRMLYEWARAEVSDAELDRARDEPGGSSLAEIWQRLGAK
jgi:hypothetical protein